MAVSPEFELHPPNILLQALEFLHIIEITPWHICPPKQLSFLYDRYPDLLGDQHEIDTGMGGQCQSWRDDPGWWKRFITEVSQNQLLKQAV